MKKTIYKCHFMRKGLLDHEYSFYEDGTVFHQYDKSQYPGGQDYEETISAKNISERNKLTILEDCKDEEMKEWLKKIMGL